MVAVLTRRFNPARFMYLHVALTLLAVAHRGVLAQPHGPPPSLSRSPNAPYNFDPSLAIIVIVLVSAFFFVGFFSIYIRQCVESNNDEAVVYHADQRSGLDPAMVESFPVFVYSHVKEWKIGKGALECAVCLSEFEDEDMLRLIPKCSHVFHPDCIDTWLDSHVTCPVCRAQLSPESNQVKESPPNSSSDPNSAIEQGPRQTQVAIDVSESRNRGIEVLDIANRPPRGRITGKFTRSHSTGHSLVQTGECTQRYTLRLPEDVRKQIDRDCRLKRTMSYQIVLTRDGSSRKGYRSGSGGGEGSSRGRSVWLFTRPPFVSSRGSVKCEKVGGGDGDGSNSGPRKVLTAVRAPLACLNGRADDMEEASRQAPV